MNLFKLKIFFGILFVALFTGLTCSTLFAQENNEVPVYKNEKKPLEERAIDLVSRMTLEEKVGMTVGDGRF